MPHIPVLLEQAIEFLNCHKKGIYIDGTLGEGGHTYLVAKTTAKDSQIIAIDRDEKAITISQEKLKQFKNIIFIKDRFENLDKILSNLKIKKIDGILLDLGFSSHQLEEITRGFSFQESPENLKVLLDMRLDREQSFSAYHLLNQSSAQELTQVFIHWGEIKRQQAVALADSIVAYRQKKPLQTIGDLFKITKPILYKPIYKKSTKHHKNYSHKHWATNLFRAIRIEVNQEIEFLPQAIFMLTTLLNPVGRLVVISFHSLEDRIIKHSFRSMEKEKKVKILTKKPVTPNLQEILFNPKSRSAKLRVIEKI
jgi:16S rRNA (cytosine1402-N4)-methyltransferase